MPPPSSIAIIRHAEKPGIPGEPQLGVDENLVVGLGSLTPRGWQRAGALVPFFATPAAGIPIPQHIYAAKPHRVTDPSAPGQSGYRPLQTVLPLARKLLHADPDTQFEKRDLDALARDLLKRDGDVLISWEHHAIASLIDAFQKALQDDDRKAPAWPNRFDMVWYLTRTDGRYVLSARAQWLLDGDRGVDESLVNEIDRYNAATRTPTASPPPASEA